MAQFDAVDEATWKAAVTKSLAGKSFEKTLVGATAGGLPIAPLYSAGPERPPELAVSRASGASTFQVAHVCAADGLAAAASAARSEGIDALLLCGSARGPAALAGAPPICVDAGEDALATAAALGRAGAEVVHALFDPFAAALAQGGLGEPLDAALARGVDAARAAGSARAPLAVSPCAILEAGGSEAQAVGFALAAFAAWIRAGAEGAAIGVCAATLGEVFPGVALVRALRLALGRLAGALGAAPPALVVGRSLARLRAEIDRPSNVLRSTNEAVALILGGADVVALAPFALGTGASSFGERLPKNVLLVLREESHLGRVADAAGGGYLVESLTDSIARAGWDELRRIEGEGGLARSLAEGKLQARVHAAAEARARDVARRKRVLVGVNDFSPAVFDPPPPIGDPQPSATLVSPIERLAPARDAAPFEALRRRAARCGAPKALLLGLGAAADYRAREGFARRFAEVGGFGVELAPIGAGDEAPARAARAVTEGAPDVVVLCGSDAGYAADACAVVAAVRAASKAHLSLAGRPGELEAPLAAAGLDDAIFVGVDAVVLLSAWLDAVTLREGAK